MQHVEEHTFATFYESQYRDVLALALVLTGDDGRAEEVTHDSFTLAYERWDNLDNPEGWVRTVVANSARSAWRRKAAEDRALSRMSLERTVDYEIPVSTEEFWAQVRKLPRFQAMAIALFYLEDRPVAEIAVVLGCAESTARAHLSRGRRRLARMLGVGE